MNSRERINRVMNSGKPDRVPFWCLLSLEHIIKHGTNKSQPPAKIEALVEAECKLTKQYNFDGSLVYLPGCRKNADISSFIDRAINNVPIGSSENTLENTDPSVWKKETYEYSEDDFYSSYLTRDILGGDIHLGGWVGCGFSKAVQWFPSLEDAMMATITYPEKFEALVNFMDRTSISWAEAQIKFGKLESIQISSPYAGSGFISLEAYTRYVLPSVYKISSAITKAGGLSYIHTCGFINDRLELLKESGTDGIECMDPKPLGDVTLADAKRRVGEDIFLKGNLDSVNLLLLGKSNDIDRTVKETIEIGKPNGKFILSTACSVSANVDPQVIERVSKINLEFGEY